jgi:hypothetical protein
VISECIGLHRDGVTNLASFRHELVAWVADCLGDLLADFGWLWGNGARKYNSLRNLQLPDYASHTRLGIHRSTTKLHGWWLAARPCSSLSSQSERRGNVLRLFHAHSQLTASGLSEHTCAIPASHRSNSTRTYDLVNRRRLQINCIGGPPLCCHSF